MCGGFNVIYITNIYFDLSQGHYVTPHNVPEIICFQDQVNFFLIVVTKGTVSETLCGVSDLGKIKVNISAINYVWWGFCCKTVSFFIYCVTAFIYSNKNWRSMQRRILNGLYDEWHIAVDLRMTQWPKGMTTEWEWCCSYVTTTLLTWTEQDRVSAKATFVAKLHVT
jgi:hypothetical protein